MPRRCPGIKIADDVQRIETMTRTADQAQRLGVGGCSRVRTLLQLGDRAVAPINGGVVIGMTGTQIQPAWNCDKNRDEIQAAAAAHREAAELERLDAERQARQADGGGTAQPAPTAATPAATDPAATGGGMPSSEPQVVGTSASGRQVVYFPQQGVAVDQSNGDVHDPSTGQIIGNMAQQQAAAPQGVQPQAAGGSSSRSTSIRRPAATWIRRPG
jgi:hypothetical protein